MKVPIFWTWPVWRNRKSPNFLDIPYLAKTRNSQFFGQKSSPNFRTPSVCLWLYLCDKSIKPYQFYHQQKLYLTSMLRLHRCSEHRSLRFKITLKFVAYGDIGKKFMNNQNFVIKIFMRKFHAYTTSHSRVIVHVLFLGHLLYFGFNAHRKIWQNMILNNKF